LKVFSALEDKEVPEWWLLHPYSNQLAGFTPNISCKPLIHSVKESGTHFLNTH
jgi:hypothetical protein